jgi:uncharacterized protein (TIGR00159 family)
LQFWAELTSSIRLAEIVDLAVVAALMFVAVAWLRGSRARVAFADVLVLTGLYFLARQTGLTLTSWILQGFMAVLVIVVIVVFQDDLRRFFEQIAVVVLGRDAGRGSHDTWDVIARALARLARARHGALVVIPGNEPLSRHLEGGVPLDGRISEPLLLSLFDPRSPGHDGAVVIDGDRVERFAVHLPLSSNHAQLGQRGTRHAAALGIAERSDALCIVVSEERGTVSVARAGTLRTLPAPEVVGAEIRDFLERPSPEAGSPPPRPRFAGRWRDAAIALGLTAVLWALAVPGSGQGELEAAVPVRVYDLPESYVLERVEPARVDVTLHGRRRDLLLLDRGVLEARVHAYLVEAGRRTFSIGRDQVEHPASVEIVSVRPDSVRIWVRSKGDGAR